MFDLKDLAGFSIEFKRDANGNVREAASYQPGTSLVLKKK